MNRPIFLVAILPLIIITNTATAASQNNKFSCTSNGSHASCNQGDNQNVTINNQEYHKHYLTRNENRYICEANGEKSICAQGDGQTVSINGISMTGRKVETDEEGNFILY